MPNPKKTRTTTSKFIETILGESKIVDISKVAFTSRGKQYSVFEPLVRKLTELQTGNALIVDFKDPKFMHGRNSAIRIQCKNKGLKLHTRRVNDTSYALWATQLNQ